MVTWVCKAHVHLPFGLVSLHTSYCYRTEDIPAVQEEVGRSTLRATVLNMTKMSQILQLVDYKKQKLLSQTQNGSNAVSVPGKGVKPRQVVLNTCTYIPLRCK